MIIGCGPAGERAAIKAARAGKSVAVIERAQVVGGTSVNWGTIPSKTLRETALSLHRLTVKDLDGFHLSRPEKITVSAFMHRERMVVQRELDLINDTLDKNRIEVLHGSARFVDEHTVALVGVDGQSRMRVEGEVILIAVGTTPNRPDDVNFDGDVVFDSNTILKMPRMPRSMIVLGAGVVGVEYAATFSALGIEVTLVDTRAELLPYMDREIAGILEREMRRLGVVFIHDDHYAHITRKEGDPPQVCCETRQGNRLEADVMLYSVGRDGNTAGLGLETVGIVPDKRGLLEVNAHYQTCHAHIYAVGDIVGYPALASTSMEQGRQAISHAFSLDRPMIDTECLPFAIYSIPEVSYIGETEESLRKKGVEYVAGKGNYNRNPRGQIVGDTGGLLKLLFARESEKLLGVHIVGTNASELIHTGQALLRSGATALQITEMPFNYPTLSDLYRHAALRGMQKLKRLKEH
ncbi:MAG: Si-specific NAD(P)(+) transhydrogenase [Deltaproteobacteria bacterium]|nr:Si-specific NAD(P)(+) transhydrogenase [Deltaproteobacteria bacterium]